MNTAQAPISHTEDRGKVINLRRFWRWRAGLAGLALAAGITAMLTMTFGGRPSKVPPPESAQVEAAWQTLVSDTLASKGPIDVSLPTSIHARAGLLPLKSSAPE